jgi:hypothetical protein
MTEILDQVAHAAAPLLPPDRESFIVACVQRLRFEPIASPGVTHRVIRALLATGHYRCAAAASVGRPKAGPHHGYDHAGRRGRHGKRPADDDAA